MHNLANVFMSQRDLDEAQELHERVLRIRKEVLPPMHRHTLYSIWMLAKIAREQGRYDEADVHFTELSTTLSQVLGPHHPSTLNMHNDLAILRLYEGRWDESRALAQECLERQREILGTDHPDALKTKATLAQSLDGVQQIDEARQLWEELESVVRDKLNPRHPLRSLIDRGFALHLACAPDTSAAALARAFQMATEATELDPAYGECWRSLGVVYAASDQWQQSKEAFIETIELGCPRELLPSALLERIDNAPNQHDEDFQQLMELVHDHTQRLTASRSQNKDE